MGRADATIQSVIFVVSRLAVGIDGPDDVAVEVIAERLRAAERVRAREPAVHVVVRVGRRVAPRIPQGEQIALGVVGERRDAATGVDDLGHAVQGIVEPARHRTRRVDCLHETRAGVVLERRGVPQRIANRGDVAGGVVGRGRRASEGVGDGGGGTATVIAELETVALRIHACRKVTGRVVLEARHVAERVGDLLDVARHGLVGERPAVPLTVDRRAGALGGVVFDPRGATEGVGHGARQASGAALRVRRLAERVDDLVPAAAGAHAMGGRVAARVGHPHDGVSAERAVVRIAPEAAVGHLLSAHAAMRVVLILHVRNALLVANAQEAAIDIVSVAGFAPGGVGHRLQAS